MLLVYAYNQNAMFHCVKMAKSKQIALNHDAPEIGLYSDVMNEIFYESGFSGKTIESEALNFRVYVMMFPSTPDRRLDEVHPSIIRVVDEHPYVQYQRQWYPLSGIPATSCDMLTLLPAIIVGCEV